MRLKYLFIDSSAVYYIASFGRLQSFDYSEGKHLVSFIKGEVDSSLDMLDIVLTTKDDCAFIFGKRPNPKEAIVFDFATFHGFGNNGNEIITIFQKILKFAVRQWENLPPSPCEKLQVNGESSIGVIFPFPFTTSENAPRVIVDRSPDSKRNEKRDNKFILVFDYVNKKTNSQPQYTLFRKAIEQGKALINSLPKTTGNDNASITSLRSVELDVVGAKINPYATSFTYWQNLLTDNQKDFVNSKIDGPMRLQGAAGTGKTLSMVLKCVNSLKAAIERKETLHVIFIAHSLATKKSILNLFLASAPELESHLSKSYSSVSVTITTLHEWCIEQLSTGITSLEYLDLDAQESKDYQFMLLQESFESIMSNSWDTYKLLCSDNFVSYISSTPKEDILEMLQHEIAVTIKGRAGQRLERYRNLIRLRYSIPAKNPDDLNFLFHIYTSYQEKLVAMGVFDSDDIILSSLGQLNTPIWRRRRLQDGYNAIFVDETHLFNFNELSIFHHINRDAHSNNIIFAIDKTQAIGERGLDYKNLNEILELEEGDLKNETYDTVFRSSPDIINVAFSVLSSGVSLFTNFENPLSRAKFSFTQIEEKKAQQPEYLLLPNEASMVEKCFLLSDELSQKLATKRSNVLIIATRSSLLHQLEIFAASRNKPVEVLKRRGDLEVVKAAETANRYVIANIDYVGGLEFDAVIIAGVDRQYVPPLGTGDNLESSNFMNYAWHNRMYVAITRAKYSLYILGEKANGYSKLLENAIGSKLIKVYE